MKKFLKSYLWIPAFIGFLLYLQTLTFGSAWGDDHIVIDPVCRDFNLMLKSFYHNIPGQHFFPFSFFQSYVVNLIFGKIAFPFGFHFYQLTMHIISCILAALIFEKITKSRLISILIVTLWTVHPLNVESLTRLVCAPAHIPAGTFCLAFIFCFLKANEISNGVTKIILSLLGILFFLISVTSYEQYILFPFVLIIIISILAKKKMTQDKHHIFFLAIPIIFIYLVYIAWRYYASGKTLFYSGDEAITWTEIGSLKDILFRAFWLAPQLLVHYFRLFFYPDYLAESKADWYKVGGSIWSFYSLFCQSLIFILIISSFLLRKKIPLFSIGVAWFFIGMFPIIQIIPIFSIVDEHYCYLPILGIFLSLFSIVKYFWNPINKKILLVFILPIFFILTLRTILYIPSVKDQLTQAIYMAQESPELLKPLHVAKVQNLAALENRPSEVPEWIKEYNGDEIALKWVKYNLSKEPDLSYKFGPIQMSYNYYWYWGAIRVLYYMHMTKELNSLFDQAIIIKPNWFGYYHASMFFRDIKDWDKAWDYLKRAIELAPKHYLLFDSLFIEVSNNGDKFNEAETLLKKFLLLKNTSAYPYLFSGRFYETFNKNDLAIQCFRSGISSDKEASINAKQLYYSTCIYFFKNHMLSEAKQTLNIILSFDPFDEYAKQLLRKLTVQYSN